MILLFFLHFLLAFSKTPNACDGTLPITSFQRAFPVTSETFLPYLSQIDLVSSSEQLKNITIIIHGMGANVVSYFCAASKEAPSNQVIIAPWFTSSSLKESEWTGNLMATRMGVFWDGTSWSDGSQDLVSNVSSFRILDSIIAMLRMKIAPNVKIVVAGFSAGGQTTQKYAIFTNYGRNGEVRFIVGSPSSYVYFNALRPAAACRPMSGESVPDCAEFVFPKSVLTCPKYNAYKYGFDSMNKQNSYLQSIWNQTNLNNLLLSYANKEVIYVLGGADICNCVSINFVNDPNFCFLNTPGECSDSYPATTNMLDGGCKAMEQGSQRLQRGLNYIRHLTLLCGKDYQVKMQVIPNMTHSHRTMFQSDFFRSYGFEAQPLDVPYNCTLRSA